MIIETDMILKNASYEEFEKRIKDRNSRIIVYGAGMIGQIVVPYIAEAYGISDHIDCFVDMDSRKTGKKITIGSAEYEIRTPDVLDKVTDNTVILLTNSKFYPVVDALDKRPFLKNTECYVVPVMQRTAQKQMIPRTIHYCWFGGGKMSPFLEECMESWKKFCPDYEIVRWDENNYDVSKFTYTRQAYECGKYAFVSDVARLDILYRYGGIYLDTDVKLLRSLDGLLRNRGFVGVENWGNINSGGGIGAMPEHPMIKEMLDHRTGYSFILEDGTMNVETNGFYETVPFRKHGMRIDNTLQIINDMVVYPAHVFHPYDYMSGEEHVTEDTYSVHYFSGGWMDSADKNNRTETQKKYSEFMKRMQNE